MKHQDIIHIKPAPCRDARIHIDARTKDRINRFVASCAGVREAAKLLSVSQEAVADLRAGMVTARVWERVKGVFE